MKTVSVPFVSECEEYKAS